MFCVFCVFCSQVSVGLLHGRASHIIWPPHRWQQIKPSLPANRGPLDTQEEEGWRHQHANIQFRYVVTSSEVDEVFVSCSSGPTDLLFKMSNSGKQTLESVRQIDLQPSCELFVCFVNVTTVQALLSDCHRASSRHDWSSGVSVQHVTAASLLYFTVSWVLFVLDCWPNKNRFENILDELSETLFKQYFWHFYKQTDDVLTVEVINNLTMTHSPAPAH